MENYVHKLSAEQKSQFSEILEELGNTLDISETQYNAAVKSYEAVGKWLASDESPLSPYSPEILPQGSFMLGIMVKPIHDEDDLDIDLVCQLKGKNPSWTQYDLKSIVGSRLKEHGTYKGMLDKEGRRCWTLIYSDIANYHMDILPSIVSDNYRMVLEKAFSATELSNIDKLAIRITCKEELNYKTATSPEEWLKSNPFGYARWFFEQASLNKLKLFSLNESIKPVPIYQKEKSPLQRVVQILKRHRDMMFDGHKHKPISIIITTLAARAYNKETNIIEALVNVVQRMPNLIQERYSPEHGRRIKWIANPVNAEENFADRWIDEPKREEKFNEWINSVSKDINNIILQQGKGIHSISESMVRPFGENTIKKAFSTYGENQLIKREKGLLRMASGTGIISEIGRTNIPQHKPFGKNE